MQIKIFRSLTFFLIQITEILDFFSDSNKIEYIFRAILCINQN